MFNRIPQSDLDEERRLRLEAERALTAARELAEERLSTINDWRELYQSEVKARAADRQTHAEELRALFDRFMPAQDKEAIAPPEDAASTPALTAADVEAMPVAGKRSMRLRTHQADDLRFREASEQERKELQQIRDARRSEQPEDLSGFHFDNVLGVLIPTPEANANVSN